MGERVRRGKRIFYEMPKYHITQIEDYEPLIGSENIERIREKARKFKGLRVANFNSTYYGGGVAETISSLTLLMNSLGLRTEWRVIQGTADFFSITKKMHNALQGGEIDLSSLKKEIFEQVIYENSVRNFLEHDFVIVHDPQPLPLIEHYEKKCPWIWRCHVDLSQPDVEMWKYLRRWIDKYDAVIVSCPEYKQEMKPSQRVFMPAINPFSIKNRQLSDKDMTSALGTTKSRPICRWSCKFPASIRGKIQREWWKRSSWREKKWMPGWYCLAISQRTILKVQRFLNRCALVRKSGS